MVLLFELARQRQADVAAAGDHHAPRRRFFLADLAHELADVVARRDEEHLVAFLDDGVAIGHDAAARAVDSHHARLGVRVMFLERAQLLADQQAALARANADQPHAAVGEVEHLQRARDT